MIDKQKPKKTPRQKMSEQAPDIRKKNFEEVPHGYDLETAKLEASRCIQCKNPACIKKCPVGVDIPGFIKFIKEDNCQSNQQE